MKKIIRTLVAASVLICGMVFTGCEFYKQAVVDNTQGQWYKYNKTVDIPIGTTDDASDEEVKTLKDASLFVYYESDEGLKVAVQAESKESVEVLNGLFSQDVTVTAGATHSFTPEEFGDGKWTALVALSVMKPCEEPAVSATPDKCLILGGDDAKETKIQWKRVLANMVLNKWLNE